MRSSGDAVSLIGTTCHYAHLPVLDTGENVVPAGPVRLLPVNINDKQRLGRK